MKQKRSYLAPALFEPTRRKRHLQAGSSEPRTKKQQKSASKLSSQVDWEDDSYGLAYRDTYKGGFDYSELNGYNYLPPCFEDDLECQKVSRDREKIVAVLVFSVIFVVIVMVIAICFVYRKMINKKKKSEENADAKAIKEPLEADDIEYQESADIEAESKV